MLISDNLLCSLTPHRLVRCHGISVNSARRYYYYYYYYDYYYFRFSFNWSIVPEIAPG